MCPTFHSGYPSQFEAAGLACVRGGRQLFDGVGFRLNGGEILYLQGKNGSGKTSLLRILCGLSLPAAGEIRWCGKQIGKLGADFRRELCYIGHQNAIKEELTPRENLLATAPITKDAIEASSVQESLERLGLAGQEEQPCRYLSQGQKRRVALARLVNERRPLWILDEPFVALDPAAASEIGKLIGAHLQRGGLAILTTHQAVEIAAGTVHELRLD